MQVHSDAHTCKYARKSFLKFILILIMNSCALLSAYSPIWFLIAAYGNFERLSKCNQIDDLSIYTCRSYPKFLQ